MCLLQGTHRGRGRGRSQREQPHWPYFSSHQRCLWASAGNESFCFSQWTEKNVQLHQSHDDTKTQTISHDWRHSRYSHEPPCQSQTSKLIGSHTRQSLHEFLCCSCFKCVVLSGADSLSSYNGPIFHLWTEMSTNCSCSLWGSPQLLSSVSVHYLFFLQSHDGRRRRSDERWCLCFHYPKAWQNTSVATSLCLKVTFIGSRKAKGWILLEFLYWFLPIIQQILLEYIHKQKNRTWKNNE